MLLLTLFLTLVLQTISAARLVDPITNFCRRVGHSSVLKNGTIFINGGVQTSVENGIISSGILDVILELDTTTNWDAGTNLTYTIRTKSLAAPVDGYTAPLNVHNAALFSGRWTQPNLWQFGGTTSSFNSSAVGYQRAPNTNVAIWRYDGTQKWSAIDTSANQILVPSTGATAEAPALGLAFYLGGQINYGSGSLAQGEDRNLTKLGGMIVLNTTDGRMANLTVRDQADSNRRGAGMTYVGMYGSQGVIVLMGGKDFSNLVSMQTVSVFDVASISMDNPTTSGQARNVWYVQSTTGDIPTPRRDFCLVSVAAQDNSSVNIYLYGGRALGDYGGTTPGTFYDEVYILSLPSFTWIKVYSGNSPRWWHTCHQSGQRQIISIGGGGNGSDFNSTCDAQKSGVSVFDMSTLEWGSSYNAYAARYLVPDVVSAEIGGDGNGGATKVKPDGGFVNDNLAKVFAIRNTLSPNSPTSNDTSGNNGSGQTGPGGGTSDTNHITTGAIAGLIIGVLALILAAITLGWFILSKRKTSRNARINRPSLQWTHEAGGEQKHEAGGQEKHELPNTGQERLELGERRTLAELGAGTLPRIARGEWKLFQPNQRNVMAELE